MSDTPSALMIFAAGFGTRMMPLTRDRPKPMVPVNGRPLIDHALDLANDAGFARIVVNTHYKADVLAAHLKDRAVHLIDEQPDILDTGGGLRNALPALGNDPVLTLNPDVVWRGPNPLEYARDAWRPEDMDALMVCIPPERAFGTQSKGDFTQAPNGHLSRGHGLIYTGVQVINPNVLHAIPEPVFSLNRAWDLMISQRRCYGIEYPGHWCDVGRPENIEIAERVLRGDMYV